MRVIRDLGYLRECFRLSPTFVNDGGDPCLILRAHTWEEVKTPAGEWERRELTRRERDFTLPQQTYVDPASKAIVPQDQSGAVNLLAFIAAADASMLGITALNGQPLFAAIATFLEDLVVANNMVGEVAAQ